MLKLFKKTHLKLNLKTRPTISSLFLNIAMPSVVLCVALFVMTGLNYSKSINMKRDSAKLSLSQIFNKGEAKISSIRNLTDIIENTGSLSASMQNSEISYNEECATELRNLTKIFNYVDSIFVYNKLSDKIITENNEYDAKNFFEKIFIYNNYDYQYWKDFAFYSTQNYRILSPTGAKNADDTKNMAPFVYKVNISQTQSYFLIINVKLSEIIETDYTAYITPNTQIYILNKYTEEVFSANGEHMKDNFVSTELLKKLLTGTENTFNWKINDEKCIISYYSSNDTIIGYTYFAIIPTKDLRKNILPDLYISLAIVILFVLLSCVLVYKSGHGIYNPLKEISETLSGKKHSRHDNILEDIKKSAYISKKITNDFTTVLPYIQERYLIDLLNSDNSYMDNETLKVISNTIKFPHRFFMIAIIGFTPSEKLFDSYTAIEYENIKNGLFNIIKSMFASQFTSYVLPTEQDVFYVILNLTDDSETVNVKRSINTIDKYLENDREFISLKAETSSVYEDISGLKKAHIEAIENFSLYKNNSEMVALNPHAESKLTFSDKDESNLFSSLISFNREKTIEIVESIMTKNENATTYELKKLYNYILNTVLRVMRIKKISTSDNKLEFEIINDILAKQPHEAYLSMMHLIDTILGYGENSGIKTNYDEIIKYIEENFNNPNLSLKLLAEHFNVTQSTISMVIKKITGIGFHKYITNLRVQSSKNMLKSTDMSITEICERCGFNSTKTFYKIFKSETGMTALQYRNTHSNQ